MKSSRSEFADIRGRRYHLRCWGDAAAPRLFMLHGWMDTAATFQFVVDAMRKDWCVIAPDWRGFGSSEANHGPYWFPDYLGDLDALLAHYAADEPARLLGHSMGGNVAALYAGVRPERVGQLILIEGFGLAPVAAETAPERYRAWLEQLQAPPEAKTHADAAALAARLRKRNPRLTAARAEFLAGHSIAAAPGGIRFAADPWHHAVNPVLYRIEEARACWRRVTARVLWVSGAQSEFRRLFDLAPDEYRSRLACFAQLREAELDDAGHNVHHDRPEELARLVEEFLAA